MEAAMEASMEEMSKEQRHKLNMDHGFMQSIIRNQVDRDNYEKACKSSQKPPRYSVQAQRNRKPEIQTYIPPLIRKSESTSTMLFKFEYENMNGQIYEKYIFKNDDPCDVACQLSQENNFTPPMKLALTEFLTTEIAKRNKDPRS